MDTYIDRLSKREREQNAKNFFKLFPKFKYRYFVDIDTGDGT